MNFLSSLFSEFAARRARMRAAFGDRTASWMEFAVVGGVTLGVIAAVTGEPRGWGPLIALLIGYPLLDYSRQRALAGGADEDVTRQRHDRLAAILFAALALLGAAFCFYIFQNKGDAPSKKFDVDITSPS